MPVLLEQSLNTALHLDKDLIVEILFQWLNTAFIIAVLAYFLYNPVKTFLANRAAGIKKKLDDAESNSVQAKSFKEDYERKLMLIETEKSELLEQARHRALERESQIIIEAKREAEAIIERAKLDIEREVAKARDDIKKQIVETSALMAEKYVVLNMDSDAQYKLVDELIDGLGDVKWHN